MKLRTLDLPLDLALNRISTSDNSSSTNTINEGTRAGISARIPGPSHLLATAQLQPALLWKFEKKPRPGILQGLTGIVETRAQTLISKVWTLLPPCTSH